MPEADVRPSASRNPTWDRTNTRIAASGAVNRPGKKTPAANPITVVTVTPATPTNTGHSGGPPQVACSAVWMYSTATPARNASSIQPSVPTSAIDCRAHTALGVVATRSPVLLRPSRDPAQAASPAANAPNSNTMSLVMTDARTVQTGGYPSAVRTVLK